jgi:hypothetical protein
MANDPSERNTNAKSDKSLPPQQARRGPGESGIEADEITPYRDRPSHDGKHGDAADEPASGSPNPAGGDRGKA